MTVSKRDILEYLRCTFGANEVVVVEGFSDTVTRHICKGAFVISILRVEEPVVMLPDGSKLPVRVFYCRRCRKLIVDNDCLSTSSGF